MIEKRDTTGQGQLVQFSNPSSTKIAQVRLSLDKRLHDSLLFTPAPAFCISTSPFTLYHVKLPNHRISPEDAKYEMNYENADKKWPYNKVFQWAHIIFSSNRRSWDYQPQKCVSDVLPLFSLSPTLKRCSIAATGSNSRNSTQLTQFVQLSQQKHFVWAQHPVNIWKVKFTYKDSKLSLTWVSGR